MYPLNLNGTKLTIEERAGQVRGKMDLKRLTMQNLIYTSLKLF